MLLLCLSAFLNWNLVAVSGTNKAVRSTSLFPEGIGKSSLSFDMKRLLIFGLDFYGFHLQIVYDILVH